MEGSTHERGYVKVLPRRTPMVRPMSPRELALRKEMLMAGEGIVFVCCPCLIKANVQGMATSV